MNQNDMVNFITLTDLDANKIELNAAYIVMMKRDTYEPEEGIEMPFTKIYTSAQYQIWCLETPEQVAQLQMDACMSIMKTVYQVTTDMLEEQFEEDL